jgi:phosphoenolpyruvate carboxykinase (ATP)
MHASPFIDVDRVDNMLLITRGPLIPAVAKLTLEQTVALMVLGQAMESSAGDPTHAGEITSQFFYDPFVAGDRADHANHFYQILKGLPHIDYYLLNTGGIGEGARYKEITVEHTMAILDSLLRGGLEDWIASPSGFQVPKAVRLVDDIYFHPETLYSKEDFEAKQRKLSYLRQKVISKIRQSLHPQICTAFT